MWQEPEWEGGHRSKAPGCWGVQSAVPATRASCGSAASPMTTPPRQYEVERALRERIKGALDARGITTPPADDDRHPSLRPARARAGGWTPPPPAQPATVRLLIPILVFRFSSEVRAFYDAVGGEETFSPPGARVLPGRGRRPGAASGLPPARDLGPAEEHLRLFLMQYWGGPGTYGEQRGHPRLRMRHGRSPIGEAARRDALAQGTSAAALDGLDAGRGARRAAVGLPGDGRAQPGQPAAQRPER